VETIQERHIRIYFQISVLIKGLISLLEVIGGLVVIWVPVAFFTDWIIGISQHHLTKDPGNFIAAHTLQLAQEFAAASGSFIAIYLISRGLIKLLLIIALLKNKLWAYPASGVVLGLFIIYQLYEIVVAYSLLMTLVTVFDFVVMYFIWREYKVLKQHHAFT
jgi:uncharacterized membrane protein